MTDRHTAEQRAREKAAAIRDAPDGRWFTLSPLAGRFRENTVPNEAADVLDALVAQVERVTRERDEAVAAREQRCIKHGATAVLNGDCPICDVEIAEAEAAALRERNQQLRDALRLLVEHTPLDILSYEQAREIARAALGDGEPPETAAKPACGRPISSESVAGDGEQHG